MKRENATISSIQPNGAEIRFDGFFFGYFYFYAPSEAGGLGCR